MECLPSAVKGSNSTPEGVKLGGNFEVLFFRAALHAVRQSFGDCLQICILTQRIYDVVNVRPPGGRSYA